MDLAALTDRGGPVRRRTNQRVTEGHSHTEFEQPGLLGRFRCTWLDPDTAGGVQKKHRIAEWLRGCEQEESLGVMWQGAEPLQEFLLDLSRQRCHARKSESAR